jgi:hypothetical protein
METDAKNASVSAIAGTVFPFNAFTDFLLRNWS